MGSGDGAGSALGTHEAFEHLRVALASIGSAASVIEVCDTVLDHGMRALGTPSGGVSLVRSGCLETELAYAEMIADVGAHGVSRFLPG